MKNKLLPLFAFLVFSSLCFSQSPDADTTNTHGDRIDTDTERGLFLTKLSGGTSISAAELSYLDGSTGNLQTQINAKFNSSGGTIGGAINLSGNNVENVGIITGTNNAIDITNRLLYANDGASVVMDFSSSGQIGLMVPVVGTAYYASTGYYGLNASTPATFPTGGNFGADLNMGAFNITGGGVFGAVVDMDDGILKSAGSINSVDWIQGKLYDNLGNLSLDWRTSSYVTSPNGFSAPFLEASTRVQAAEYTDFSGLGAPVLPYGMILNTASFPVPVAGDTGKFIKYDHGTTSFVYDSIPGGGDLLSTNNLSELTNIATARTNLGLGTAATTASTAYATAAQGTTADGAAQKSANLSDLANAATARSNLGLGTAATTASTAYATAAQGTKADTALQNTIATSQATTSGTAFDFTGIPSGVKKITVHFRGVSLTGTDHFLVQVGATTPLNTGYSCAATDGTTVVNNGTGFVSFIGAAAAGANGHMILVKGDGYWTQSNNTSVLSTKVTYGGGGITLGNVDIVRVTRTGTNTFDAGEITVSYEY